MIGAGTYEWVDAAGELCRGTHWDDLPAQMDRLVRFEPAIPPEPHSQADHDLIDTFVPRLREAMQRCRR